MLTFVAVSDKHILKKYNISIADLAEIFEAKNEISFRNSSAYNRYIRAAAKLIQRVEQSITTKING